MPDWLGSGGWLSLHRWTAVTTYLSSKQLLLLAFSFVCITIYSNGSDNINTVWIKRFLLGVFIDRLQLWHIGHFIYYFFICFVLRRESVSVVIIPRIWTVWDTAYVCTKEQHRPQRDSNPVPSGSMSTTLSMTYPWTFINMSYYITRLISFPFVFCTKYNFKVHYC